MVQHWNDRMKKLFKNTMPKKNVVDFNPEDLEI